MDAGFSGSNSKRNIPPPPVGDLLNQAQPASMNAVCTVSGVTPAVIS
jgi:hypothetical protein